jgi:hypothetical protein
MANVTWTSLLLWPWERMMSLKVRGKAPSREDRLLPSTRHAISDVSETHQLDKNETLINETAF